MNGLIVVILCFASILGATGLSVTCDPQGDIVLQRCSNSAGGSGSEPACRWHSRWKSCLVCSDRIERFTYSVRVDPKDINVTGRGVHVYANTLQSSHNITASTIAVNQRCTEVLLRFIGSSQSLRDSTVTLTVNERISSVYSMNFSIFYKPESTEVTTGFFETTEATRSSTSLSESTDAANSMDTSSGFGSASLPLEVIDDHNFTSHLSSLPETTSTFTTAPITASDHTTRPRAATSMEVTPTSRVNANSADPQAAIDSERVSVEHCVLIAVLPAISGTFLLTVFILTLGVLLHRTRKKGGKWSCVASPVQQSIAAEGQILENLFINLAHKLPNTPET